MMIKTIITSFEIYGDFINATPFGNGLINETYLVKVNQAGVVVNYILRKINKKIFKNPLMVINNTISVINHLSNRIKEEKITEVSNNVIQLVTTVDNKYYFLDENNDYWNLLLFIDNAYTVDFVKTEEQAYHAAKEFGKFQKYLLDIDTTKFEYTIPNFHNLTKRLKSFDEALKKDVIDRVKNVTKEIDFINKFRDLEKEISLLLTADKLPIRITHNDTKINNIMFNKKTHEGQCVIDLDTVMPGTILYDFGDMVRTSTSPVEEDEKDITKVTMRIKIFEKLVKGYLEELSTLLTNDEIYNLILGAEVIVYEQAIRFLTDYLVGDVYYPTSYTKHNIVRTHTQIALLESIKKQRPQMEKIISKYSNKIYHIQKSNPGINFADQNFWKDIPSAVIDNYLWSNNSYTPKVDAKLSYSDEHLFLHFISYEKEIRATYTKINSSVHKDSCVEFFFNPFPDNNQYINFEVNAIGTIYVAFGDSKNRKTLSPEEITTIQIVSTFTKPFTGITEKEYWEIYLKIPITLIEKQFNKKLLFGNTKGNFYKCGDDTKFEHYGAWSRVKNEGPNFHLTKFFGTLIFSNESKV